MLPSQSVRESVAVIGDARVDPGSQVDMLAEDIGRRIVGAGYRLVTGGLGGVMEAACRGGRDAPNWSDGAIVGIIPSSDPSSANPYVDVIIPTGLDHARNQLVAQTSAVVAVGGGAGTSGWMTGFAIRRSRRIGSTVPTTAMRRWLSSHGTFRDTAAAIAGSPDFRDTGVSSEPW